MGQHTAAAQVNSHKFVETNLIRHSKCSHPAKHGDNIVKAKASLSSEPPTRSLSVNLGTSSQSINAGTRNIMETSEKEKRMDVPLSDDFVNVLKNDVST